MPPEANSRKILLVTRNLPPLVGGMERMMQQFSLGLLQYADLTVIGPKGCRAHLPAEVRVHECPSQLAQFLLLSTWRAMAACRKTPFDVIIGGSGLIAPTLRVLSRLYRCKTLVYLHGLDLVVNNPIYQLVFIPSLRNIDSVAVNSKNTHDLAIEKGIAEHRLEIVNPGTHLPAPIDTASRSEFRRRHGIEFERYLVFTGRMTKRKGLSGFLQNTLPQILQSEPDIGLIVVGEDPRDSLNQLGEQAEIQKQITILELENSVKFLGKLSDRDLEICYSDAEVQIFPLTEVPGDVEGFGMVAIEAAACGTPTVAFELGGVADAVTAENGYLVPPGNFRLFAERVIKILRTREPDSERCIAHARQFSWQAYNQKMQEIISRLG